jgi:MFS family permease
MSMTPARRVPSHRERPQRARPSARPPVVSPQFVLCFAANFLQNLAFTLYLHLSGFLHELGADEVRIGVIVSVTAATAILWRPPLGTLMDERGRRGVILAGGVLNVLVCALYPTVQDLGPWLYVVRAAHGLAEATLFTALMTHAADLLPPTRRTEGIGLYGISGLLPMSVSGVLGDVILRHGTYADLFHVSTAFALASLLLSLPLRDVRHPAGELPGRGFVAAVVQPDLLPLWFIGLVFATALTAQFTFVKTFVLETGIGSVGLFFTAYSIAAIVLRLGFAWLPERVGPKRVLIPALATLALGYVLLALAATPPAIAVAGACAGLGHGFTFPILSGLVVDRARTAERGAATSIFTALFDAGALVGGPLLGAIIRDVGYPAMFLSAAALVAVGGIVFTVADRRR